MIHTLYTRLINNQTCYVHFLIWLSLLLLILLIIFVYIYTKLICKEKILISICCIDERVSTLDNCLKCSVKSVDSNSHINILGIIRKKDKLCEELFLKYNAKILYVNNYTFNKNNRHNFDGIAEKRTKALKYAKENKYSILIFVDADIYISNYTLKWIIYGIQLLNADIICVPYNIRWANNNDPVLGYIEPVEITKVKYSIFPYHKCAIGGMGCTGINLNSNKIPNKFNIKELLNIKGEDIGFFFDAFLNNAKILTTSWYQVYHDI